MNNWELSYQKRTILKYFVEGKVKENFKKVYFSNILVLTSLSYIIEITKETFIFETFFHFSPNKNFHFNLYLMNTIQITRYIEWISLFFFIVASEAFPPAVTSQCNQHNLQSTLDIVFSMKDYEENWIQWKQAQINWFQIFLQN